MYYQGESAIEYLGGKLADADPGESSHWRKFHSEFHFSGSGFSGLDGFGGYSKKWRTPLHRIMQKPYRRFGRELPDFGKLDKAASGIASAQNRAYDIDVLRQCLTVAFLRNRIPETLSASSVACVIGDGFGTTTSLLLSNPVSAGCVVLVNLTKTLLVDLWYLRSWMGTSFDQQVCLITDEESVKRAFQGNSGSALPKVIAIQAKDHSFMRACPVDYVVNTVSMQEMDPPVIAEYFEDMRTVANSRGVYFYCANREEKLLPDGTITRFSEYPWDLADGIICDELCPWHQTFYTFRPPFYRPYDGPIRHRLLRVAGTN